MNEPYFANLIFCLKLKSNFHSPEAAAAVAVFNQSNLEKNASSFTFI